MRFGIVLLIGAILVQSLSQAVLVLHYGLNKDYIIEQFCVNKAKPEMKCNGKCHLNKTLKENTNDERQVPKFLKEFSQTLLFAYQYNFSCPPLPCTPYRFAPQPVGFFTVFTTGIFQPPRA
jgi:hypothetical protein